MSDNQELSIWDNIKNSRVVIQYIVLIIVMSAINMILNRSYGNLNDTFYCANTAGTFFNSNRMLWIYTALVYIFIVGVREWTKKVDYAGTTEEERKEEFKDFGVYIVICLSTFIFAGAYIRRKFNTSGVQGGGGGDGIFKGTVSKISSTSFGTLALYTGIIIILINVISNSYQYLKNKRQNVKDRLLRAIYFGQITTMFIFLISSFFIAGFGCSYLQGSSGKIIFIALLKWSLVIAGSILGIHMINIATDGENWFGDPKGTTPQEGEPVDDEPVDGEVDI
tara:strand:+ start:334 stop:1173 length:840 start_codon:yes stop_codon:yes gene_type:complete